MVGYNNENTETRITIYDDNISMCFW